MSNYTIPRDELDELWAMLEQTRGEVTVELGWDDLWRLLTTIDSLEQERNRAEERAEQLVQRLILEMNHSTKLWRDVIDLQTRR